MSVPARLGDFRIDEEIGRGGFGIVYRGCQVSLDRPVAVKVLYEHKVHTRDEIARFEREARAAARLDHPSVVPVHAWGEDQGSFYIVQKLVGRGRTLADELADLKTRGEPPKGHYRWVADCIARVAEGLAHAHERGIIHRDVKPSNILLDERGQPFLGDFGLAKVEDGLQLSRTGDFAGSPYYMSPEQADSRRGLVDHRSDLYALGVTLYELLTLQPPFVGRNAQEIIRKILTEEPRPASKLAERVPTDLETICLKAMEKPQGRRYQSAGEMAQDLRAFLEGEPISASPPSAVSRIWRKARRHRQAVGMLVLAAALLGVAIASERSIRSANTARQFAEFSGLITEAERATEQQVFDSKIQRALAEDDPAHAREVMAQKLQWEQLLSQGGDLVRGLLPEIQGGEIVDELGSSLQQQLPLLEGARALHRYLSAQEPAVAGQADPRLAAVSDWLENATSFLGSLDPGEILVTGDVPASEPPRALAPEPLLGAPPRGPPTQPDGSVHKRAAIKVRLAEPPATGGARGEATSAPFAPGLSRKALRAPHWEGGLPR